MGSKIQKYICIYLLTEVFFCVLYTVLILMQRGAQDQCLTPELSIVLNKGLHSQYFMLSLMRHVFHFGVATLKILLHVFWWGFFCLFGFLRNRKMVMLYFWILEVCFLSQLMGHLKVPAVKITFKQVCLWGWADAFHNFLQISQCLDRFAFG